MKAPNYDQFIEDAPSSDGLSQLSSLAHDLYLAEVELLEIQEKLKEAQQKARNIAEHDIPELMDELGLTEFSTKSGVKLKIIDVLRCSIPVARRDEAYAWLQERGFGDLIKRNVITGFGRDEGTNALELAAELTRRGLKVKDELKVEPSTLKKFVLTQLEEGASIPLDLFGASQFRQAKITAKPESAFGD